jgi:hypothetical protein
MTDDKEAFERGYWDGRQAIKRMIPLENIFQQKSLELLG